jgi:nucleotide-binding universal stress UspA family protein
MLNMKKILVPVDFSATSKMAVNYGLSLALEFQAKLVLAHIVVYEPRAYDEAKAHLLELIPAESREKLNFEIIVKSGDVREEILGIVKDIDIDLVVMGTHGRSYIERMLLGSVTERMLRKLPVPVLTVSHLDPEREMHKPGPVPLRQILYATDLSDDSEPGLSFAIRIARELDAGLTVTHVVDPIKPTLFSPEMTTYLSEFSVNIRAEAEERLNRFVALQSDGTVPTTTVLADGFPAETINKIAAKCKADLIVINLQSRGLLDRALLGSTAERVIRTATVPVLSLPLPATYASRWAAA